MYTCFFDKEVPEEEAEAQLNNHEEELFRHPVPVDMSVKGVSAVQVMVKLVRMLVNLYQNGGIKEDSHDGKIYRASCEPQWKLAPCLARKMYILYKKYM
jgi:hypothetical protein